jgi:hypothetical protein
MEVVHSNLGTLTGGRDSLVREPLFDISRDFGLSPLWRAFWNLEWGLVEVLPSAARPRPLYSDYVNPLLPV